MITRLELKEMMGGMGICSIEALRGNRMMLRGIHLQEEEQIPIPPIISFNSNVHA